MATKKQASKPIPKTKPVPAPKVRPVPAQQTVAAAPGYRYLPSYKFLLSAAKELRAADGKLQALTLPLPIVSALLRELYLATGFNEEDYLERYPDVKELVRSKKGHSALEHFVASGFFEGRLANCAPVAEEWYRKRNPDVWQAIKKGQFKDANEHYFTSGANEGRSPSPELESAAEYWSDVILRRAKLG